jgi:type II secretory pathway pseudopilin PulG
MKSLFSNGKFLAILAGIIAIAAVVASIWLNPPSEIRARKLDQVRMSGLQFTKNAIEWYYRDHHALPTGLNVLDTEHMRPNYTSWHDPETQLPFEYEIVNETSYKLCVVFSRRSDNEDNSYNQTFGKHSAGRDCFQQSVSQYGQR